MNAKTPHTNSFVYRCWLGEIDLVEWNIKISQILQSRSSGLVAYCVTKRCSITLHHRRAKSLRPEAHARLKGRVKNILSMLQTKAVAAAPLPLVASIPRETLITMVWPGHARIQ
jgi:hypothetical protein